MRTSRVVVAGALLAIALPSCVVVGAQPATPQRPTFSSNTNTTAEGTVEMEAGYADDTKGDRSDSDRTASVTFKYGLSEKAEVFVAGLPYVEGQRAGRRESGLGETTIGARHRIWENDDGSLSFAYQASVELPTGSTTDGLSNGEEDFYGAAILSGREENWGWTAFYQHGRIDLKGGDRTGQDAFALAVDTPIDDQVSAFAELAYIRTRSIDDHPKYATVGLAWAQDQALIWDFSVVRPFNNDGPDTRFQIGATVNWGHLFGEERREAAAATPN
ncbi:MAG: hypothetical protein DHS20C15_20010 [Planctomycetota bacterium]|nr:MAG: hypothetical protein DHS20C15_20010 [Planctomycetota bacterium]